MSANIPYSGSNDLPDSLKDYFTSDQNAFNYLIIKKKKKETIGLVIHDSSNEVFGKQATNLPIKDDLPPPPPPEELPKAIIKPDEIVAKAGDTVYLYGDSSKNANKYEWKILEGNLVLINNPSDATAFFIIPKDATKDTVLRVSLTVYNKDNKSDSVGKRIFINEIIVPPPPVEKNLPVKTITASAQDSGREADKTIDGNFETRWSAEGDNQYIEHVFDKVYKVTKVRLTGFHYDKTYYFEINGKRFENSAGRPPNTMIEYDLTSLNIVSDRVRLIGHGNDSSTYNSYREIEYRGFETDNVPPPDNNKCPDGQCKDPNTGQCRPIGQNETKDPNTGICKPIITPPPTGKTTRLLAFADNDTTTGAEQVLGAMMKVQDVNGYLFGGDGPYAKSGTKWVQMMKKYFNTKELEDKLTLSQGNHEDEESESEQTQKDIEEWFPYLKETPETSGDQSWENPSWLSVRQFGIAYIINLNSQDMDIEFKRNQYNWVVKKLKEAKALRDQGKIRWIIAVTHKPWFTLKSSHSPYTAVRNIYYKDFIEYGVDFVVSGHNHNTQFWVPMTVDPNLGGNGEGIPLFEKTSDGAFDYDKPHGFPVIVTGHSGHEWNLIKDNNKNVMFYKDSGKFGFTQFDLTWEEAKVSSIDSDLKEHFSYRVVKKGGGNNPPPQGDPVAKLSAPSQVKSGQNVILDASQSIADTVEITQTSGQTVSLSDAGTFKKSFIAPNVSNNISLGFQAIARKEGKQSITQIAIQVSIDNQPPPNPDPVEGKVLWDSNIHLKVDKETKVTGTFGNQSPDGKGIHTAASGNPRAILMPDGTFYLEADKGHGRIYIKCKNFNAMMVGELMFTDDNIRNTTLRLRSRHNEGGECKNRFGGFGATVEKEEQLAEFATEPCHNLHSNTKKEKLKKPHVKGQWIKFKYQVCNSPDNKAIQQKLQYDYNDGQGFVTVCEAQFTDVEPYMMEKADFDKESYAWLRVNNEKTGKVAYKNVKIIEINKIT